VAGQLATAESRNLPRPCSASPVDIARALIAGGVEGDRYGGRGGNRGITVLQAEHLDVLASLTGVEDIAPAVLRCNLVVSGINLVVPDARSTELAITTPPTVATQKNPLRRGLMHGLGCLG